MSSAPIFDFQTLPLRPAEYAATLGPTVIIAPHPDDESLGCGGLLALLRQASVPVWCVLVSDGTMSHPNSTKFPPAARQALRETELRLALAELGVGSHLLQTLHLPDGAVPTPDTLAGAAAVRQLHNFLRQIGPKTILCPWRRDPHPDHRATSELVRAALATLLLPPACSSTWCGPGNEPPPPICPNPAKLPAGGWTSALCCRRSNEPLPHTAPNWPPASSTTTPRAFCCRPICWYTLRSHLRRIWRCSSALLIVVFVRNHL